MRRIGGALPVVTDGEEETGFFEENFSDRDGIRFMMSGRCALYYALLDMKKSVPFPVVYAPAYTCETVLAACQKAGYSLRFYAADKSLRPVPEEEVLKKAGVLLLCGYYGYNTFDMRFVETARKAGVRVLLDATQSVFSGHEAFDRADYIAASFRKWRGVHSGGVAVKKGGAFTITPEPPDEIHLKARREYARTGSAEDFWNGENYLRACFSAQASDEESIRILRHMEYKTECARRRENYRALLSYLPAGKTGVTPVFCDLPADTVPCYFPLYAPEREKLRAHLWENGIGSAVYWPKSPLVPENIGEDTAYIYSHILALPCDGRYSPEDMRYMADVLLAF